MMRINLQSAPSKRMLGRQKCDSSDQHDGGEPEHGFQQLLNAADQVIRWPCSNAHDVHLLGQLIGMLQRCSVRQDRQLTQDGAMDRLIEATTICIAVLRRF